MITLFLSTPDKHLCGFNIVERSDRGKKKKKKQENKTPTFKCYFFKSCSPLYDSGEEKKSEKNESEAKQIKQSKQVDLYGRQRSFPKMLKML